MSIKVVLLVSCVAWLPQSGLLRRDAREAAGKVGVDVIVASETTTGTERGQIAPLIVTLAGDVQGDAVRIGAECGSGNWTPTAMGTTSFFVSGPVGTRSEYEFLDSQGHVINGTHPLEVLPGETRHDESADVPDGTVRIRMRLFATGGCQGKTQTENLGTPFVIECPPERRRSPGPSPRQGPH